MFLLCKIKSVFVLGSLFVFLTGVVCSMEFEDRCLRAYIFMHDRSEYSSDAKRSSDIQTICADPTVTSIDFSLMNLIDTDLDDIFSGLIQREMKLAESSGRDELALLNISCENISEAGLKSFIRKLQKGEKIDGKKTIPDVRNTVLRIGFPISSEFGQELQTVAPSVFAGSLRLVY